MKSIIKSIHPKCFLLSVQPRHTANIFDLLKTIEWRKKPLPLGHYYCYETKGKTDFPTWIDEDGHCIFEGRGEVIGEFDIVKNNKVQLIDLLLGKNALLENGCVGYEFLVKYAKKQDYLWANDIANVKKFDKPKALSEFYITKKCVPVNSYFGDKQNWDDRHKRCSASLPRESWGIPIECHRCKNLYVAKEPYLDEKSGCMLFDYDCKTKYHKPIARAPQNYCYCEELEEIK